MPNSLPTSLSIAQLKPLQQDPARPFPIFKTALDNKLDTPIAVKPKAAGRSWLQALLPGFGTVRGRIANIQKSMLVELGQVAALPLHEDTLARQIVQAEDAESLWALRLALAEAIGSVRGDVVARQKMTEISFMFAGLLRRRIDSHEPLSGENVVRLPSRGPQSGARS